MSNEANNRELLDDMFSFDFAIVVLFEEKPRDVVIMEGETAVLSCVTTDFTSPVTWKCNHVPLRNGDKYDMRKEGKVNLLLIRDADSEDTGIYSCDTGDVQSSARLTVTGKICVELFR